MPVMFDFGKYAATYGSRAEYVSGVVSSALLTADVGRGDVACDVGAGSGHLTAPLLDYGLTVDAVEPSPDMRALGERRTAGHPAVTWYEGTGEDSGRPAGHYDLVSFGGSFDRTDRPAALREVARILRPGGHLVCLWNHRLLDDPLQSRIEELIRRHVPDFQYGVRRSDQRSTIENSGLFENPVRISGSTVYQFDSDAWCDVWRSHSTLGEQAGDRFDTVVDDIRALVHRESGDRVTVPYETVAWVARCQAESGW